MVGSLPISISSVIQLAMLVLENKGYKFDGSLPSKEEILKDNAIETVSLCTATARRNTSQVNPWAQSGTKTICRVKNLFLRGSRTFGASPHIEYCVILVRSLSIGDSEYGYF